MSRPKILTLTLDPGRTDIDYLAEDPALGAMVAEGWQIAHVWGSEIERSDGTSTNRLHVMLTPPTVQPTNLQIARLETRVRDTWLMGLGVTIAAVVVAVAVATLRLMAAL